MSDFGGQGGMLTPPFLADIICEQSRRYLPGFPKEDVLLEWL